jgi:hypothetical protein
MGFLCFLCIRNFPKKTYGLELFIIVLGFGKRLEKKKRGVNNSDFVKAGTIGLICFVFLTLIIILGIKL